MLSEEKKNRNSSIIMLSQDITLLLYPVVSSRGDLVSALLKHVYDFLIKIDDVTI